MAESSIAGLFQDPLLYQQAQDQAALQRFTQLAQLDPLQQAQASLMYGGYQAGGALGRALGGEDPMLKQLSMRNQLASQFDTSSAEGLINLSNALRQKGDLAGASQVAQQAMVAREKEANIQAKLAEKLTPQQKNAAAMADSQYQRGTPEWMASYNKNLSELANPEKLTTDQRNYNAAVEGGYKGTFQQWLENQKLLGRNVTNINMPAAEKAFDVKLAELDAKTVDDARKMRDTAVSSMKSLNQLASLPSEALISGEFASGRVGATNLLATLGLASEADVNRLSKSQQYQKVAGDVVLQTLGGKLGAGFSNEDRKFIQSLVPQLETNPEARRQLIQFMQQKNQDIVAETTRLENYAREKKGLKGFEYKIPIAVSPSKGSAASSLSVEELKRIAGVK